MSSWLSSLSPQAAEFLLVNSSSLLLVVIGVVFWRFQLGSFLVGKRGDDIDKKGVGKWIGTILILLGILLFIELAVELFILHANYFYVRLGIIFILTTWMYMKLPKYNRTLFKAKKSDSKGKNSGLRYPSSKGKSLETKGKNTKKKK